jgi:hypothetical protein
MVAVPVQLALTLSLPVSWAKPVEGGGSLPARVLQFGGKFSFLKLLAS